MLDDNRIRVSFVETVFSLFGRELWREPAARGRAPEVTPPSSRESRRELRRQPTQGTGVWQQARDRAEIERRWRGDVFRMWPRCSREAAERPPRGRREAAERPPTKEVSLQVYVETGADGTASLRVMRTPSLFVLRQRSGGA